MTKDCNCHMCRLVEAVINAGPDSVIEAVKYTYNETTIGYIASELQGYSDQRREAIEAEKRMKVANRRAKLRVVSFS